MEISSLGRWNGLANPRRFAHGLNCCMPVAFLYEQMRILYYACVNLKVHNRMLTNSWQIKQAYAKRKGTGHRVYIIIHYKSGEKSS